MDNMDEIKVQSTLSYAYSEDSIEITNISMKVYENTYILANDLIDELINRGYVNIDKTAISLYDEDLKMYIYLGISPLESSVKIQISKEKLKNFQVNFNLN